MRPGLILNFRKTILVFSFCSIVLILLCACQTDPDIETISSLNPDKAEFESVWQYLKAFSIYQDSSLYTGRILESPYLYKNTQMMFDMVADTLQGSSYTHYKDMNEFAEFAAVYENSNNPTTVFFKKLTDSTGILKISTFIGKEVYPQFLECIAHIPPSCKNLIIDLRGNTGGSIAEVDSIIWAFLPVGVPYIMVRERNLKYGSGAATNNWHKELTKINKNSALNRIQNRIVWMDEWTASASEILAIAFKEREFARLVGSRSFGKGIGQVILGRNNRMGLQITFAQFRGINNTVYHGIGIKPDVQIATNDTASVIRLLEPSYKGRTVNVAISSVKKAVAVPACYKIIDEDSLLNIYNSN